MIKTLHNTIYGFSKMLLTLVVLGTVLVAVSSFVKADNDDELYTPVVKYVKCYPNPATAYINFEFSSEIDRTYSLVIMSFIGKQMEEKPVADSKITITLNSYLRGLYIYQLKDKSGRIVETGRFQVDK